MVFQYILLIHLLNGVIVQNVMLALLVLLLDYHAKMKKNTFIEGAVIATLGIIIVKIIIMKVMKLI